MSAQVCSGCARSVVPGSRICRQCGALQAPADVGQAAARRRTQTLYTVAALLLLVVLVLLLGSLKTS